MTTYISGSAVPSIIRRRSNYQLQTTPFGSNTWYLQIGSAPASAMIVICVAITFDPINRPHELTDLELGRYSGGVWEGFSPPTYIHTIGGDTGFFMAYGFVPPGLANDSALAVQAVTYSSTSSNLMMTMQVALYDGVDPAGTVLFSHVDNLSMPSSPPDLPTLTASSVGVVVGAFCLHEQFNPGHLSPHTVTSDNSNGPFAVSMLEPTYAAYQTSVVSTIFDVRPGTTPSVHCQIPSTPANWDISTAAIFLPAITKLDSVGDLVSEG